MDMDYTSDGRNRITKATPAPHEPISIGPNHRSEEWYCRGLELFERGQYSDSLTWLDKAIAINPDDTGIWYAHGHALVNLMRYSDALTSFDKALPSTRISLRPGSRRDIRLPTWSNIQKQSRHTKGQLKSIRISLRRGITAVLPSLNSGRYSDAVKSYDRAIEINPDFSEAWYNRGIALTELGRYTDAVTSYDKAVEINPDFPEAWYNRGIALTELGRYTDAVTSYDKAVEINPDFPEAWYNRGIALAELGRYTDAENSFEKGNELNRQK